MRDIQDTWAKKAKLEGFKSRASYKLIQIDDKHKLIQKASSILELGSAPGGWSQVISKRKSSSCVCKAIDILPMDKVEGIDFIQLDLYAKGFSELIQSEKKDIDLILSDMSVNLSGIKLVDDESNKDLNYFCLELSKTALSKSGALLIKTFNNQNLKQLKKEFMSAFHRVFLEKPPASKTSSAEVYLLGLVPK